jgi:hypothetical protein
MSKPLERAVCIDCGGGFWREPEQSAWRFRCVPCWLARRADLADRPPTDHARAFNDLRAEIGTNFRALVQLIHPDRHGNSATDAPHAMVEFLRERLGL